MRGLGDRTFLLRPMPPKVIRANRGATRQQLQTVRRAVGRLGDARIQNKTRFRYYYAAACFQYWLTRHGGLPALSFEDLDHQLSEYVEWLWDGGFAKNEAGDCLSGVQHFLRVKRKFPTAWALFRQWTMLEPPCRAPPIPLVVLFGMVGAAKTAGLMSVCVVLLTAFGCFLRTNEALSLQPWQFHFNSSRSVLVVTLGWTKSAGKRGAVDSIVCDDPYIVRLVAFFLPLCPAHLPLVESASRFQIIFQALIVAVDASPLNLRLYSLRRGGATYAYSEGVPLDAVIERGRWNSISTARIYINHGLQEIGLTLLSPNSRRLCTRFGQELAQLI